MAFLLFLKAPAEVCGLWLHQKGFWAHFLLLLLFKIIFKYIENMACIAYMQHMPYGPTTMTIVNMGVYQNNSDKLDHWSKLELIWPIGWAFVVVLRFEIIL